MRLRMAGTALVVGGIVVGVLSALAWAGTQAASTPQPAGEGTDRVALAQALPPLDGAHVKVTALEVVYGPGEASAVHTHPCPVVGYVVEGALRTQVKGQPEAIYKAGDSFYEPPDGVHQVCANASRTRLAKFVVFFVCDHDTELSLPVPTKP